MSNYQIARIRQPGSCFLVLLRVRARMTLRHHHMEYKDVRTRGTETNYACRAAPVLCCKAKS
eukprot:6188009-Pleurochrysis_carterae.AAC.5